MATDVMDLLAKVSLDTDDYDAGLNSLSSKTGTIMKGVGAAVAAATAAVVAFAKESISTGMSFDQSMSQVAATMGKTVDEISELRDFAQEMGATTAFSATQAADALNYMALAGYDAQTSMQMLPNVLNLAASGGIDLAYASDMITDSQSALGLSLEETTELVDKMAQAASKSNTSVAQLGEAILQVGGTAKNLSGGTTELATVLGILADNGIKGAEGGTALRNILNSLTAPTDTASKMLKDMGVSVFDTEGNIRSLNDVFGDLQASMSSMTQQERMNVISTIFNARDMKSAEALLANVGTRYQQLSGYIDEAAGSAQKMADVQLDNLAGNITIFKSALEGAQIAISDELTPTLNEFVKIGAEGLQNMTTAFKENGLEGAVDVLSDTLDKGINKVFEVLPDFVSAGVQVIQALSDGILKNTPVLLNGAKDLAVSLVKSFTDNAGEQIRTVVDVASEIAKTLTNPDTLQEITYAGLDMIVALAEGIVDNIPSLTRTATDIVVNLIDYITDKDNIEKIINSAADIVLAVGDGIIDALPELVYGAGKIAIAIIDGIFSTDWLQVGRDVLTHIIDGFNDRTVDTTPVSSAIKSLSQGYFDYYDEILDENENALRDFAAKYSDVVNDVGEGFTLQFDGTEDAEYVMQVLNDLQQAIEDTGLAADELSGMYNSVRRASLDIRTQVDIMNESMREFVDTGELMKQSSAHFIPTEAIRQQAGKAAEPIYAIGEAVNTVEEQLEGLGTAAASTAAEAEEIVYKGFAAQEIGTYRNLGVEQILGHVLTDAEEVADKIASEVYSASNEFVQRLTEQEDLTVEDQIEWWKKIQAQFVEGSEQFLSAGDKILSLQKKNAADIAKAEADATKKTEQEYNKRLKAYEQYQKSIDTISDKIEDIENNYADTLKSRTEEIYNSFGLFEKVPERILYSGIDLTNNLQNQIDSLEKFYADIATLSERGVSGALVEEIQSMGVGAIDQLDALLDLSDDELSKYDALFARKNELAATVAENQLTTLKDDTNRAIMEQMEELDALSAETGKELGIDFATGIADGIKAGALNIKQGIWVALENAKDAIFGGSTATSTATSNYIATVPETQQATATAANSTAAATATESKPNIVININGIQYQDFSDLAKALSEELQFQIGRAALGYAGY